MKTAKDYIDEANKIVQRVPTPEGIALHATGDAVFVDVRDSKSLRETGTIAGALHIPRGMIELSADPATPYYNKALTPETHICLVCGGGVTAALAGKTLKEMGYPNVTNVGGMKDWIEAGGPAEAYDG